MKYRLLSDHYLFDRIIPAGTVIGDGTAFPFTGEPSNQMEGMDDASKRAIETRFGGLMGGPVESLDINGNPPKGGEGSDSGPLLRSVGEPQRPTMAENPVVPAFPDPTPRQLPPYPIEQTMGSAVARPDPSLTPEERQQAADAINVANKAPDGQTDAQVPEGSQEEAEPVEPVDTPPAVPPVPTVSGAKPNIEDILKK